MERDHLDTEHTDTINKALDYGFPEVARIHDQLVTQTNKLWRRLENVRNNLPEDWEPKDNDPLTPQALPPIPAETHKVMVDKVLNRASASHATAAIVARIMYARWPDTAATWFNEDDPS